MERFRNEKKDNDIDFVITWVDGNDAEWIKEKNKYKDKSAQCEDDTNIRFRDWNNLKYWFRGVEKFTPWVNKIYFVTWGHIPKWLNTNNEKLVIVNHKDYIPKEYLPTFNSHTIELNLHRIKGLKEKFVYFNDDTFIIDKMNKRDFFFNNLPRATAIMNPYIPEKYDSVCFSGNNNISLINNNFSKRKVIMKNLFKWYNIRYGVNIFRNLMFIPWSRIPGFVEFHLPNAYLKSTFTEIWNKELKVLDATCKSKYRNVKENVNQWLIKSWQIMQGKFKPYSNSNGKYYDLTKQFENAINAVYNQQFKMVCLNDTDEIKDYEIKKQKLIKTLDFILPEKSSFEK